MYYKFQSDTGIIMVKDAVIKRIVHECIALLDGKVRLANHKGQTAGLVAGIVGLDDSSHISVSKSADGVDIKLYVVIKFGTSITRVTEMLIESIRQKVLEIAEIEASSVSIVVSGMQAKKLARRNIEVRG
jgi:uncharacterized alkaline shock family protein YloU